MASRVAQSIQLIFGRVDRLQAVGILQGEIERQTGKVEIGQIFDRGMLEEIIGVVKNGDGEIGRIAKDPADLEAGGSRMMDRRRGGEAVEASELQCPVGL